jgi:hypothetical protein
MDSAMAADDGSSISGGVNAGGRSPLIEAQVRWVKAHLCPGCPGSGRLQQHRALWIRRLGSDHRRSIGATSLR